MVPAGAAGPGSAEVRARTSDARRRPGRVPRRPRDAAHLQAADGDGHPRRRRHRGAGHQGHPGARQGQVSSSGRARRGCEGAAEFIVVDAPAAGHAVTFLSSAYGLLDAAAVGPDPGPGHRRGRLARRPRPLPGDAGHPARRKHRSTRPSDTAFHLEDRAGVQLAPIVVNGMWPHLDLPERRTGSAVGAGVVLPAQDIDSMARAAAFRRQRQAAAGSAGGPAGGAVAAAPGAPAVPVHHRPRAGACDLAGGGARRAVGGGSDLRVSPSDEQIDEPGACSAPGIDPASHHLRRSRRGGQDHHGGRHRGRGRPRRPAVVRGHHRPGQAARRRPGPRRADQRGPPGRRPLGRRRRAVGAHARHQDDVRRGGDAQRPFAPSRPAPSSTTGCIATSPAPWAGRRNTWRWRSCTSCSQEERFDLVVVDTPPTRHALDFLDAPGRLMRFLNNRIFRLLMMPTRAGLRAMSVATQMLLRTISRVVGGAIVADAVAFFAAFEGMEQGFRDRAALVEELLVDPGTAFVVVAVTPAGCRRRRRVYFADRLRESSGRVEALVANRMFPSFGPVPAGPAGVGRRDRTRRRSGGSLAALIANLADLHRVASREEAARRRAGRAPAGRAGRAGAVPRRGRPRPGRPDRDRKLAVRAGQDALTGEATWPASAGRPTAEVRLGRDGYSSTATSSSGRRRPRRWSRLR